MLDGKAGTDTHVFVNKAVVFNLGNIVPGEKSGKGNNNFFYHHTLGRQSATDIS